MHYNYQVATLWEIQIHTPHTLSSWLIEPDSSYNALLTTLRSYNLDINMALLMRANMDHAMVIVW